MHSTRRIYEFLFFVSSCGLQWVSSIKRPSQRLERIFMYFGLEIEQHYYVYSEGAYGFRRIERSLIDFTRNTRSA